MHGILCKSISAIFLFPRVVDDNSLLLRPDRWDKLPEVVNPCQVSTPTRQLSLLVPLYDISVVLCEHFNERVAL
jgi:hypothetical protein